ncbi:MAG: hypothetical protein V1789_08925 [PVC group bacterium]
MVNVSPLRGTSRIRLTAAVFLWLLLFFLIAVPLLNDRRLDSALYSPFLLIPLISAVFLRPNEWTDEGEGYTIFFFI